MKSFTRFVSSVFPAARLPTLSPAGRLAISRRTPKAIPPPVDLAYEESGDAQISDDDCSDISDLLANLSISDADDQDMPDLEDIDSRMKNGARHICAVNDAILLGPAIPPLNATVNITRASDMTQVGYAVVVESAACTWPAELTGTTEQPYTGLWYSVDPPSIGASITLRTKHGEFYGLATIATIPPPASVLLQYRPAKTRPLLDVGHVPTDVPRHEEASPSPPEPLDVAMVASPIVQDDVHPSHLWPTFTSAMQRIHSGATGYYHAPPMHDDSTAVTLADQDPCSMDHSSVNEAHNGYEDKFILGGAACKKLEEVDEDIEALIESFEGLTIHDDVDDYYYGDSKEVNLYLDGADHSFEDDKAAAAEVDDIFADAWLEELELGFIEEEEDREEDGEAYGVYWEEVKYTVEGGESSDNEFGGYGDVTDDREDFFGCLDDDVDDVVYHDVRTEQEDYDEVHEIYIEEFTEDHLGEALQEEEDAVDHYNGCLDLAVIGYEGYAPFDEGEELVDDAAQEGEPYYYDNYNGADNEDDEEYTAIFGPNDNGEDIAVLTHEEQEDYSEAAADTDKSIDDDGNANITGSEGDTTTSDGESDDEVDPIDALIGDFEFVDTGPKEPLPKRPLIRLVQTVTPEQMVSILKKRKSEDSGDEEMEVDNGERKVKRLRVSYKINKGDTIQNAEELAHMPLLLKRSDKDAAPGEDVSRDYSPTMEKEEDKESPPLSEKARGKRRTVDEDEEPSRLSEKAKGKWRAMESDKEETQHLSEKAKGKRKARDDDDDPDDTAQDCTQPRRTIKRVRFDSHPQPAAIDSGNEASDENSDAEDPDFQEAVRRSLSDFAANPLQDVPLAGPSSAPLDEPEQSHSKFNLAKKKVKAKMAEKIKKAKDVASSVFSKAKRITFKYGGKVVRTVEKKPES